MPENEKSYEILPTRALSEELAHIKHGTLPKDVQIPADEQTGKLDDVFENFHRENLSALCFSGGGIRSATFGLGIVQALAEHDLLDKFDYLSTVSGGGYLGAWLSAWIRREQLRVFEKPGAEEEQLKNDPQADEVYNADLFTKYQTFQTAGVAAVQNELNRHSTAQPNCPNIEPKQLQYLREYSNYMSPKVGLLSADTWTLLGIYTRNLFLNWTIFVPLMAAVLLIPQIILALTDLAVQNQYLSDLMLIIGLSAGSFAIRFIVNKLPSKNTDTAEVRHNTDGWILAAGILPLVTSALAAATFWAWYNHPNNTGETHFKFLPSFLRFDWANFIIFTALIFLIGYLLFQITKRPWVKVDYRGIAAAFVSSLIGGFLMWLIAEKWLADGFLADTATNSITLPLYVCLAVPVYLLTLLITATIFVGLSSMFATDDDREWLARFGAWILIVGGAWSVLSALVLFGPYHFYSLIGGIADLGAGGGWIKNITTLITSAVALVSGILSLAGGFSGKSPVTKGEPTDSRLSKFLSIAPKPAGAVFLVFLLTALAAASEWLRNSVHAQLNIVSAAENDLLYLSGWFGVLALIGIVMACFVNVNKFSLHGAYRDRLIRAYLGASHVNRKSNKFTGFDDADNFQLHRLKGQKPFHIINATLNLVDGKNLAWQNRKAASFTMSPLHCGSWLLGYRPSNRYSRNRNLDKCKYLRYCNRFGEKCKRVEVCELPGKALRLGTAMAISGAAANPNMGYYSSPVVTFLMSLFNIRLGWWLGNTGKIGDRKDVWGDAFYTKTSPSIAVLPLVNETFGRTDENKRYLNITDGGHFENLGLYETVLRRCKLIVLSDAAADDKFTFGELSNAIEKCKVDLGVDIVFTDGIHLLSRHAQITDETIKKRFAVADVIYPETDSHGARRRGKLLYIRPTYYGDEATEIKHYADADRTFPHQSTADQLYDEKQFEAYRALGFCIMDKIIAAKSAAKLLDNLRIKAGSTIAPSDSAKSLPELFSSESSDAV